MLREWKDVAKEIAAWWKEEASRCYRRGYHVMGDNCLKIEIGRAHV